MKKTIEIHVGEDVIGEVDPKKVGKAHASKPEHARPGDSEVEGHSLRRILVEHPLCGNLVWIIEDTERYSCYTCPFDGAVFKY